MCLQADIIHKYFPELSQDQKNQFFALDDLYRNWNSRINVISRNDIDELYTRHVLHSLSIAKVVKFMDGTTVLDVGTGGGFPGIPLSILFPEVQFALVDSIGKKIKVVNDIVNKLSLENIRTHYGRAEDVEGKYDFIVSRAVAKLDKLNAWVSDKIKLEGFNKLENGFLLLKGGELQNEIDESGKVVSSYSLSNYFSESFFDTKVILHIKA